MVKSHSHLESKLVMFTQALVLVYAFVMTTVNLVRPMGVSAPVFVSILVMIAAIFLLVRRETYLPFLGYAAVPITAFKESLVPDKANVTAILKLPGKVPDGTRLLYWGAKAKDSKDPILENPWKAYHHYKNTGVVMVQDNMATLVFHCPARYKTPMGIPIQRHIHYRLLHPNGLIGPVETHDVKC